MYAFSERSFGDTVIYATNVDSIAIICFEPKSCQNLQIYYSINEVLEWQEILFNTIRFIISCSDHITCSSIRIVIESELNTYNCSITGSDSSSAVCDNTTNSIMATPIPTVTPTLIPTITPTIHPTTKPTAIPAPPIIPTATPTIAPLASTSRDIDNVITKQLLVRWIIIAVASGISITLLIALIAFWVYIKRRKESTITTIEAASIQNISKNSSNVAYPAATTPTSNVDNEAIANIPALSNLNQKNQQISDSTELLYTQHTTNYSQAIVSEIETNDQDMIKSGELSPATSMEVQMIGEGGAFPSRMKTINELPNNNINDKITIKYSIDGNKPINITI